jgi:hypothetical protein
VSIIELNNRDSDFCVIIVKIDYQFGFRVSHFPFSLSLSDMS